MKSFTLLTIITTGLYMSAAALSPAKSNNGVTLIQRDFIRSPTHNLRRHCKTKHKSHPPQADNTDSGNGSGSSSSSSSGSGDPKPSKHTTSSKSSSNGGDGGSTPMSGGGSWEGKVSFYGNAAESEQLANPACVPNWQPDSNTVYGFAFTKGGQFECNQFWKFCNSNGECHIGRAIDECPECGDGQCDLTPKLWGTLGNNNWNLGILNNIHATQVEPPTSWNEGEYGPQL